MWGAVGLGQLLGQWSDQGYQMSVIVRDAGVGVSVCVRVRALECGERRRATATLVRGCQRRATGYSSGGGRQRRASLQLDESDRIQYERDIIRG